MAYSDSPLTLQRLLPQLRPLAEGAAEVTWRVPYGRAKWWAHRVREALRIARQLSTAPAELKQPFVVKVLTPSYVRASLKQEGEPTIDFGTALEDEQSRRVAARVNVLIDTRDPLPTADRVKSIFGQWLTHLAEGGNKLYIERAGLSDLQLRELWEWTQREGLIFFENEGAITLMQLLGNEKAAPYAWSPEDL